MQKADCRELTRSVSFEVLLLQFRPNGAAIFQPRASDQRERRPGCENNMKSQALKGNAVKHLFAAICR